MTTPAVGYETDLRRRRLPRPRGMTSMFAEISIIVNISNVSSVVAIIGKAHRAKYSRSESEGRKRKDYHRSEPRRGSRREAPTHPGGGPGSAGLRVQLVRGEGCGPGPPGGLHGGAEPGRPGPEDGRAGSVYCAFLRVARGH